MVAPINPVTVYGVTSGGKPTPVLVDSSGNLQIESVPLGDVLDLTLSLDTSAYADNDVLAAPQEVTGFFRVSGGRARLQSVVLLDEDDQGQDIDLIFLNADGSLGAENAAFGPTDAVARTVVGTLSIVAADYCDAGNSMIASGEVNMLMEAAAASTSVWVGAVVRSGTPTYTASGIRLKLGVAWE